MHISEWPFIVDSLRYTCALIMMSHQHLDVAHLWGGMDYLSKAEVLTITHLDRFVNNFWEKWYNCVSGMNFRSLSPSYEKWEQKQKCCVYIFVECRLCNSCPFVAVKIDSSIVNYVRWLRQERVYSNNKDNICSLLVLYFID